MGNDESKNAKNKTHELSEDTINLLIQSTNLNKPTIENWHKQFLIDCPDGRLNKAKFEITYSALYPNGDASKFSGFVFEAFDKDKSGFIDFPEFLTALFFLSDNGDLSERLRFIFRVYDIDGNGKIDKKEMEKIVIALYDLRGVPQQDRTGFSSPSARVQDIMDKLDKDGNNFLTEHEFVEGCLNDLRVRAVLLPTQL